MKYRIVSIFLVLCLATPAFGGIMQPVMRKKRVGTPPHSILKTILTTNSNQLSQTSPRPTNKAPYITWLADADSRLQSHSLLPTDGHHVYPVRNLANQLTTALGSVDYGIHFLHTPILLITGNSDNELMALLLSNPGALPPAIRAELDHLFLPASQIFTTNQQEHSLVQSQLALVEANVDYQVELAIQRYAKRLKNNRLVIIGSVFDIGNHYGHGHNSLQIININGETKPQKMLKMRLLKPISPQLLTTLGRQKEIDKPRP